MTFLPLFSPVPPRKLPEAQQRWATDAGTEDNKLYTETPGLITRGLVTSPASRYNRALGQPSLLRPG